MKSILTFCILLTFGQCAIRAQTADAYVTQGRSFLAATNIVAANNSFSNAVAISPTNQTANAFYAVTRLLVLPSQPTGSNFLTRLGFPAGGRNIYGWKAKLSADTNGVPIAPAGVDANEATALLRTNVLSVLVAAEANLAAVTDTNFTLSLTSDETRSVAVTVDYGDMQVLRAMLQAAEYFSYTTYSWNLDAQLTVIRSFYANGGFSVAGLLDDYPQLLTFATTNDLGAAETAFVNGASRYLVASQFIRNRPAGAIRLFTYDAGNANEEKRFRLTISDLASSLTNGIVTLQVSSGYSVFLPSHFSGAHTIRSFLPQFQGNGFVVGSMPDTTFGGLLFGPATDTIEHFLAQGLKAIPQLLPGFAAAGQTLQFPIIGLKGRGYVIQISTNLFNWSDYTAFVSLGGAYAFTDPAGHTLPHRFYRVVDRTANMPPPANDNFANRIPLTGLGIRTSGYDANATVEAGEINYGPSIWWSWTAPSSGLVVVSTAGSLGNYHEAVVYTGTTLGGLTVIPNVNSSGGYFYNGYAFNASAGTTYQIQVGGYSSFNDLGGIQLVISTPPTLTVTSPANGMTFSGPTNITISASTVDSAAPVTALRFYTNNVLAASTANSALSVTLSNLPPGSSYDIEEIATDALGLTTLTYQLVTIPPPNDNFANAIALPAALGTTTGSNVGATKESGEPNPGGLTGGSSVWWSWTAPSNESVHVSAGFTNGSGLYNYALLGVYTGNSVSSLTSIGGSFGSPAQIDFAATAGVNYKIAVDGEYGTSGNIILTLSTP